MIKREAWMSHIKRNSGQLRRMKMRLFSDLAETLEFVAALYSFLCTATTPLQDGRPPKKSYYQRVQKLMRNVRNDFANLTEERAHEVIKFFLNNWENEPTVFMLAGSRRGDLEQSVKAVSHLLSYGDINYGDCQQQDRIVAAYAAFLSLVSLSGEIGTCTWENLVRYMHDSGDTSYLCRLISLIAVTPTIFLAVPLSHWRPGELPIKHRILRPDELRLPVPDDLAKWFNDQLDRTTSEINEAQQPLLALAKVFRRNFRRYCLRYEDMWLDMLVRPRHALRPNGLDSVTVSIPELKNVGYERITLFPRDEFPEFRAVYTLRSCGRLCRLGMVLEPSDLNLINIGGIKESDPRVTIDRILAYAAVTCMWQIVMSQPVADSDMDSHEGGGGAAVVRPHFRRLPEGRQISPEARARALATFRTEPLPGFTFVRSYQRGEEPRSGEPLFAIDSIDI